MELTNEFDVPVAVERAWAVLTDVERIAPCLPGAELREVEGDEYRGVVKVKVGPITASYQGAASFVELDETSHRAVLKAEGRESRGQGNAGATITATMAATPSGTHVTVVTDLAISGKVAQFGRGVLADVSAKLLEQFVANLESSVLASDPTPTPAEDDDGPGEAGGVRHVHARPAAPVDLLDAAGTSLARRVMRPAAALAALAALLAIRRRRRRR
jgi:uncharacterized protein